MNMALLFRKLAVGMSSPTLGCIFLGALQEHDLCISRLERMVTAETTLYDRHLWRARAKTGQPNSLSEKMMSISEI
jgi:hypothetical protein